MINTGITLYIQTITSRISNFTTNLELINIVSGSAELNYGGKTTNLEPDDIVVINRGQDYELRPNRLCCVCFVSIEPALVAANCGGYVEVSCDSRRESRECYGILRSKLRLAMLEYLRNDSRVSFSYIRKCCDLADYLCREFQNTDSAGAIHNAAFGKNDRRIEQIVDFIHNNYQEQISLSNLADTFHVSESHLSRQMKATMGIGFREYLCKVRLQHAVEDLTRTDKLVISIANDCGFPGISAFNKAFKDAFGMTPSAYRKENCHAEDENDAKLKVSLRERLKQMEYIEPRQAETGLSLRTSVSVLDSRTCPKPWEKTISVGSAADLLNPRMQKQLLQLKQELKFSHVKMWGLFNEDILVTLNGKSRSFYFNRVDEILYFLIRNDIKPFLQLGPKPRTRIRTVRLNEEDKANVVSETDKVILDLTVGQWQLLIDDLISHLITKFGGQEMESWIFEMWAPCRWDGIWLDWYSEERFAAVYRTIKQYLPLALVGGCEFTECYHGPRIEEIAQRWRQLKIDPDFVSFTAFPYEVQDGSGLRWQVGKGYFKDLLARIQTDMERAGWKDKPLFLSNWNMSISGRNYLNDSVYKGSYLLENVMESMDKVDMIAYWVASDIYSEYVDSQQILFVGLGLLSVDGFYKPAYYALQFLGKLRGQLLELHEHYIVSCNRHGMYTIIYQNIAELSYFAYLKDESDLAQKDLDVICEKTQPLRLELSIRDVKNGVYNIRQQKVTNEFGSILDTWNACGGYKILDDEDRAYISEVSVPKRSFSRLNVINGAVNLVINADPNEFGVVEIIIQANQGI